MSCAARDSFLQALAVQGLLLTRQEGRREVLTATRRFFEAVARCLIRYCIP